MGLRGVRSQNHLRLPTDVYGRHQRFAIDQEIKFLANPRNGGVCLAPRWDVLGVDAAISFGRRTLEVGFIAFAGPHPELLRPEWAEDWKAGVQVSTAARDTLQDLLLFMAPSDPKMKSPQHLEVPLYRFVMDGNEGSQAQEVISKAQAQAETLHEAWRIISALPEYMERRRRDVAASAQNAGDPAKRKFVAALATSWVFLTGRAPGKTTNREKSPFVRFADAAWGDLGGFSASFDRAVRALDFDRLQGEEFEGRPPPF